MINSLPVGNLVLEFILNNLHHTFEVFASVVDGVIHPNLQHLLPNLVTVPSTIVDTCSTAGVYLFQHIETGRVYIGASSNVAIRLAGRLSQFSGIMNPFPFHSEVNNLGGISSVD